MGKVVVVNVAGLSYGAGRNEAAPALNSLRGAQPMMPSFPAVTCSVQATLTTGKPAADHGIIANGLYNRDYGKVAFWEQSDRLVQAPRLWDVAKEKNPDFTSAVLFWQNIMGAGADILMTPAPIHKHDGGMVSSCYSQPAGLYDELAEKLGAFDLMSYWGPMASIKSSRWIASAAKEVFERFAPNLTLVYLPHLDYPMQKLGPEGLEIRDDIRQTDDLIGEIKQWAEAGGAKLVVLSEYGMTPTAGPALTPNKALRQAGLLNVRTVEGMEFLDVFTSRAFAMVDHQVAHIYAQTADDAAAARKALETLDGVKRIYSKDELSELGVDHPRAGDLVAVARPDTWFAYYWWLNDEHAPDFARSVDIHRKPGYDPCELFIDMATRSISLNTGLVKGSHGAPPETKESMAFFACDAIEPTKDILKAEEVSGLLLNLLEN